MSTFKFTPYLTIIVCLLSLANAGMALHARNWLAAIIWLTGAVLWGYSAKNYWKLKKLTEEQ